MFLFAFAVGATKIFPGNIFFFVTKCRKNDKCCCSAKIDLDFQPRFGATISAYTFVLYSLRFDALQRTWSLGGELPLSILFSLAFIFNGEIPSPTTYRKRLTVLLRIHAAVQDFLMFTLISENDRSSSQQEQIFLK